MWKTLCRKSPNYQGLSAFEQRNQHVINIFCVECVDKSLLYQKLSFPVVSVLSSKIELLYCFLFFYFSAPFFRFTQFAFFTKVTESTCCFTQNHSPRSPNTTRLAFFAFLTRFCSPLGYIYTLFRWGCLSARACRETVFALLIRHSRAFYANS